MASASTPRLGFATSLAVPARGSCAASPASALHPAVQRVWTPLATPAVHRRRCGRAAPTASAAPRTSAPPVLTLNTGDDTTITVALPVGAVAPMGAALNGLLASFKAVATAAAAGKRDVQPAMEFVHEEEGLRVALECNPNLHASAFKATVYVKVASGGVVVATQALLTRLVDNVKQFKAAVKASEEA